MTTNEKIAQAKMALELCDELQEVAKNVIERHTRLMAKVSTLLTEIKREVEYGPNKAR